MKILSDAIEFDNIDDLCIFVRYDPKNDKSVSNGYVLAEDMLNNKGGVLYAKDTEIDSVRIKRLIRILENNPEVKPKFIIKLNDIVVKIEEAKMLVRINRLIDSKASSKVYGRLMASVKKLLESSIHDIFASPELILYISKLKFLENKSKKSKISPFYNHMLNTLIFSMGIVAYLKDEAKVQLETDDIGTIGVLALFHAVGGWETSGENLELPLDVRKVKYIEANEKNYETLKNDELISQSIKNDGIFEAIKYCYEFQTDKCDFFNSESKTALYANIVCVASSFNQDISGLWGTQRTAREVIDAQYVKVQSQKMPKPYVDALAKSLQFNDMFEFYQELEILMNSCKRNAGKPYPMTGFKSPIIFVCEHNIHECKEYVASSTAISVFKEMGGLKEGQYGRCEGLTAGLVQFYGEHYKEIKDEVKAKQIGPSKVDDDKVEERKPATKAADPAKASGNTEQKSENGSN